MLRTKQQVASGRVHIHCRPAAHQCGVINLASASNAMLMTRWLMFTREDDKVLHGLGKTIHLFRWRGGIEKEAAMSSRLPVSFRPLLRR